MTDAQIAVPSTRPESMQEATASGEMTTFDYRLNAFEAASQSDNPAREGYAEKRRALYAYVRHLEARADALAKAESTITELRADKERLDKWLTKQVHRGEGVVTLGLTEDGIVGVWLPQSYQPDAKCDGAADSALAAIDSARNQDSNNQRGE